MILTKERLERLIKTAVKAKLNSYSPHSEFKVGSAIMTEKDKIYPGTNVEFDAFSLTICAERSALFNGISYGEKDFVAIAIATDMKDFKYPCGLCRQALVEFNPNMKMILINKFNKTKVISLKNLLPNYFKLNN